MKEGEASEAAASRPDPGQPQVPEGPERSEGATRKAHGGVQCAPRQGVLALMQAATDRELEGPSRLIAEADGRGAQTLRLSAGKR